MAAMDWMADESGDRARVYRACAGCAGARELPSRQPVRRNTLPNQRASHAARGKARGELCKSSRKIAITSRWAAICAWRNPSIHKKVIGRGMSGSQRRLAGGSGLQHLRRTLALLHQPARQHGGGILFEPLVEQRADLLSEIGGVAEARKFIALQRGAGSREKEFPRGLRLLAVHKVLLETVFVK